MSAGTNPEKFKDYSSRRLETVLANQRVFLDKAQIPGTSLLKAVLVGEIDQVTASGKPYKSRITLKGDCVEKGFEKVINSIRADITGNQSQE